MFFIGSVISYLVGSGIAPASFYSSKTLRTGRFRLRDADIFESVRNRNASDVGNDDDSNDEDFLVLSIIPAPDCNEDSTSDENEVVNPEKNATAWSQSVFSRLQLHFSDNDENFDDVSDIPTLSEYFSNYVPKSIFATLSEKTNMYSAFKEGCSVGTTEEEMRRLVSLANGRPALPSPMTSLEALLEDGIVCQHECDANKVSEAQEQSSHC